MEGLPVRVRQPLSSVLDTMCALLGLWTPETWLGSFPPHPSSAAQMYSFFLAGGALREAHAKSLDFVVHEGSTYNHRHRPPVTLVAVGVLVVR